jgi:hypothetical protein
MILENDYQPTNQPTNHIFLITQINIHFPKTRYITIDVRTLW